MSFLRRTFLKTHSHTATNSSRTGGIVFDKNLCFRFRQLDEKQIQSICQRFASGEGGWNSTPKPASIVVVGTSMVVVFIEPLSQPLAPQPQPFNLDAQGAVVTPAVCKGCQLVACVFGNRKRQDPEYLEWYGKGVPSITLASPSLARRIMPTPHCQCHHNTYHRFGVSPPFVNFCPTCLEDAWN